MGQNAPHLFNRNAPQMILVRAEKVIQ